MVAIILNLAQNLPHLTIHISTNIATNIGELLIAALKSFMQCCRSSFVLGHSLIYILKSIKLSQYLIIKKNLKYLIAHYSINKMNLSNRNENLIRIKVNFTQKHKQSYAI